MWHSQKAKPPAMMPLATAVGNMVCASFVNGACSTVNNSGGITSLSLVEYRVNWDVYSCREVGDKPVHGHIVVDSMQ